MKKLFAIVALVTLGYFALKYLAALPTKTEIMSVVDDSKVEAVPYKIELVAQDLYVPWSIVFTSEDRILLNERDGKIREIVDGKLNPNPLLTFSDVSTSDEEGLMGLALDPDYVDNKFLYVSYAYDSGEEMFVKIVKLLDEGTGISFVEIILDKIPAARFHAGNRLRFGPDGYLYSTTGDATDKNLAQDKNSLAGKILRLVKGEVEVYSLGHRNPQGLDWHPEFGFLISTEHGPSVFDGPAGGDEINHIKKGENYGWPIISHTKTQKGLNTAIKEFTPAIAPASGVFYSSDLFPQFKNDFFFGALKGEALYRVRFDKNANIESLEKLSDVNFGRIREVAVSPKGEIYFSTSNRDGRGTLQPDDDKIYKLVPNN